jgi:hypothetical protein
MEEWTWMAPLSGGGVEFGWGDVVWQQLGAEREETTRARAGALFAEVGCVTMDVEGHDAGGVT